ncbi:MAG: thiol:disulfide interchange protein DsbA/DsbL [Betaproteobacteria bacterium]
MKKLASFLFAIAAALPLAAAAQQRPAYTELKPPLATEAPAGKIDVIEFFWYGCIHCYNLEPVLEPWIKKLPPDAQFRRVPAVFSERWAHDAAIFYTFEALGVLDKLHRPFFDAIHRDRLRSDNPQALAQWLEKNGVNPQKFSETMKSFGVQSKTKRAIQLTNAYKIDGTPAMAVQGRYTVSAEQGGSREGMLESTSKLIDLARTAK